jgi:hypothetical protein
VPVVVFQPLTIFRLAEAVDAVGAAVVVAHFTGKLLITVINKHVISNLVIPFFLFRFYFGSKNSFKAKNF